MRNLIVKFWRAERGVTAIEYGLIAALISVAIIGAASNVGQRLRHTFEIIAAELEHANTTR